MIYIWLKLHGKSMKAFSWSTRISWLESSMTSGPQFNIKTTSYQYRKSHCGDKTILRPSYLHNGISYTGKITSLYWIRALKKVAKIEKIFSGRHVAGTIAIWMNNPVIYIDINGLSPSWGMVIMIQELWEWYAPDRLLVMNVDVLISADWY